MPDKIIEIPGVGRIAFPDTMKPEEIDAAASKLYQDANKNHPPPAKEHSWMDTAVDWLPTVAGAAGGIIGAAAGPAGAIGGAALGGATGKAVSNMLTDDPQAPTTLGEGLKSMGSEAAWQGGAQAAGMGALKLASKAGSGLMTSALKPAYKTVEKAVKNVELPRVVKTLLDEGVNVTEGGIGKINSLLKATNDQITDLIRNSTATVSPAAVARTAKPVMQAAGQQVAGRADKAAARGVIKEFVEDKGIDPVTRQMRMMPVQEAQATKQATYKALNQRAYGETKGAAVETEKALARGLKEGIEQAHPEIKGMNAREGALIEAKDAIAKRVAAAANRDPGGIGWIAENPTNFFAFLMSRSPAVKSMLARGLYQSASKASGVPENLIRLGMQALATSEDE